MTRPFDHQPVWLQCEGKERFDSAALAASVARRRNVSKKLRKKGRARRLEHYRCQHCGFFHIGGQGEEP